MFRLLLALLILLPGAAFAVDPRLEWFTLETEHFRIHFHEGAGMEPLAQRVGSYAEQAHQLLAPLVGTLPKRKTEVVLRDDVDSANGSADVYLRPNLVLLAEVPADVSVLNDYEDPVWDLVVHEYAHVLHLDTTSGLPALYNAIFGKTWVPNGYVPSWLTEGFATFQESNLSNAGRNRSAFFDMFLRTEVLETGRLLRLDELTGRPTRWPRGNAAYLHGGRFFEFIARRVGPNRLADVFHQHGRTLIPYALNRTAEDTWGESFEALYDQWSAEAADAYRAEGAALTDAGLSSVARLTDTAESTGQPQFSADGTRLFYLRQPADEPPAIYSMDLDGGDQREVWPLRVAAQFDLAPDDQRLAIARLDVFRQFQVFEDLYEVDLRSRTERPLTHGLRATEPAYSPDGLTIAFVGRSGGGRTWLGLLSLRTGEVTRLLDAEVDARVFTPDFFPSGEELVFSQQVGSGRALRALRISDRTVRELIVTPELIVHPFVAADGTIYASSDRTGIYNLFALPPGGTGLVQLTNLLTGGFEPRPSPDGTHLAFALYGARGFDVALAPNTPQLAPTGTRAPRPAPVHSPLIGQLPVTAYQPARSLLPLYWAPTFSAGTGVGTASVTTGGEDALSRHSYQLSGSYDFTAGAPGFSAGYHSAAFYPSFDLAASSQLAPASGFPAGLYDRHTAFAGQATFPVSRNEGSLSASLGYELRFLDPRFSVDPVPETRRLPVAGRTGALSIGMFFTNGRAFAESISTEDGVTFAISLRRAARDLGGTFNVTSADGRFQLYQRAPWADGHVFGLRLAAGASLGDLGGRRPYSLGGISVQDPVFQLIEGRRSGPGALRGFAPGALSGNGFALGTAEYRFPLVILDRGLSTFPVFLRRLHGAVFSDVGAIADTSLTLQRVHPSLGFELRSEFQVGYFAGGTLRLGLARGFGPAGIVDPYFALGSSF